jgi:hypothetical protein
MIHHQDVGKCTLFAYIQIVYKQQHRHLKVTLEYNKKDAEKRSEPPGSLLKAI